MKKTNYEIQEEYHKNLEVLVEVSKVVGGNSKKVVQGKIEEFIRALTPLNERDEEIEKDEVVYDDSEEKRPYTKRSAYWTNLEKGMSRHEAHLASMQ